MRRARAYSSSCSQVVLVYLLSLSISSQFTLLRQKNRQKITKTSYFEV